MARVELLVPKILKWEGGYVNDPADPGGATNMGVTLSTWRAVGYDKDGDGDIDHEDIKLLNVTDATRVLKTFYWDKWKADQIVNQSIANVLVDWYWSSGKWGIIIPQRIVKVDFDGVVGPQTLRAINGFPQHDLFLDIWNARAKYIDDIIRQNPKLEKFRKGWMNRLHDYKFEG